jgi:monovalent cation:H+ antiporter-2, CPA2 family
VEFTVLNELAIVFALAVGVLLLCHRLRIPAVIGFLLTGVVAGPYGLGLVSAVHEVEVMAEVGVVLLLFTIGLELSPGEILRLGRRALGGGTGQVLVTTALFALAAHALGVGWRQAAFAGCLVALSSTAIVLRLLEDRAATESPAGRMSLAILLFQDLAVVPMILLAPLLAGETAAHAPVLQVVLGLGAVVAVLVVGRWLLPVVLHAVVRTRSREAFLLATLVVCLGVALITSHAGLSLALGAFLAGLLLAGSPYSLTALQGVLPFRDVFTSLFFVSVGMLLDARILVEAPLVVLGGTAAVIGGKALVATAVVLALGYPLRPAVLVGLALGQVGEFAFVLARSGLDLGLLDASTYQLFLATSIATMMTTPLCVMAAPRIAGALARLPLPRRLVEEEVAQAAEDTPVHLVVVGFGLGGRHLARAARHAGIPYRVLEMNPVAVREEAARGEPICYGDATLPAVLEHAGAARARVLAVVVSDPVAIRRITEVARRLNPGLHLVVRTRFVTEVEPLCALGADDVVAEEFETSVEVFTRVLAHCLVPHDEIEAFTEGIRSEGYAALRAAEPTGISVGTLALHLPDLDVVGFTLKPGSPLDGRTLAEADLRRAHGLTVLAIRREGRLTAGPDGSWRLEVGDVAWVFGAQGAVAAGGELFRGPALSGGG